MNTIGAIVLAAGRSRRFGGDKRRHRLADGRAMLATTLGNCQLAFAAVRLVLAPGDDTLVEDVRLALRDTDDVVFASRAREGMGHSLAAAAVDLSWRFAFVVLADMPYILPSTYAQLIATAATLPDDGILIPCHHGERGHPVGFGRDYFAGLREMSGDQGAKDILRQAAAHITRVAVDDPGVLQDIDRPV
ncbi:MAG: nucleotidyltransferase family protein [Pseudomonadales bacterium]